MASKKQIFRHLFAGGWATDFGPSANVVPNQGGDVILPFLVDAENVFFELDGGSHKIGGTTKLNSAAVASGAEIMGLFDFWRMGTGGSGTQKRVLHAGTIIAADAADGTFVNIGTGFVDNAVPCYTTFNDKLIISSDSTVDAPQSYDGTTLSALGGTPPTFAFSCAHKNRVWAAGDAANPSTLSYSALLNQADWVGATAGTISIDPNDGDRITGLVSHKDDLWVFKGPYFGSIHRITGSAPTGSDAFSRIPFIRGIGCVWHNTIFRFRDDVGFMWSDATVHSLNATASFGDYSESALSRPIHGYFRDHVNFTYLRRVWAANDVKNSRVLITIPADASTFCNRILMMDYAHEPVRWALWNAYDANCVARVIDGTDSNRPKLYIGGKDGYVRRTGVANRSIDAATAIAAKVTTPFTNYGNAMLMKTISGIAVGIAPRGNYNMTVNWTCDTNASQTATLAQSGGNVLGGGAGSFTLDDPTLGLLGGSLYADRFIEEVAGEYRAVSFQVTNNGLDEDLELHSITSANEIGSLSMENS